MRKCPTGNYVSPFSHFDATRLYNSTDTCLAILNEDLKMPEGLISLTRWCELAKNPNFLEYFVLPKDSFDL